MSALMVFVPLVFEETIAAPVPAPVFVPVLVNVRSEAPDSVQPPVTVVKRICWLVTSAVKPG